MSVEQLTRKEFSVKIADTDTVNSEWKYRGNKPALVDFYATWCGPCKALGPVLEELAGKYKDKIYIYKVDVDKEEELSDIFKIRTVPTLLFIPVQGKPRLLSGVMPKAGLEKKIQDILLR
ncbi:MAG: thioredoxin [Coprobacter sp.]|jgi:thioredoxin|uniref:thioredoxin n=1 Tax=Barnesiella propionica TaxID=2981781 RepID=UPI000D78F6E4|nr:thioredoxin [Barnesiella propionica]MBO1734514.1 thioredoxin [Barnesiella sp. GGCC_0306]MBS7040069.1 thioredoxin [Bacteroidales bacterium]MCU6767486.1 thioredoxin [Barnesiella propionica]PWM90458.1 MAG: thioredoxin [Coprobacter sp.]